MLNEQEIKELLKRMSEKDKDVLILMINITKELKNLDAIIATKIIHSTQTQYFTIQKKI